MSELQRIETNVMYTYLTFPHITDSILQECSDLFSTHYGVWSSNVQSPLNPGENVKISVSRLKSQYLFNKNTGVILCRLDNKLVGYACFITYNTPNIGICTLITQLVVDIDYRSMKIGQKLIQICLNTDYRVAGLISSHPFAILGLEKCTNLKCNSYLISKIASDVLNSSGIPYLQNGKIYDNLIDTQFYIDHTEVNMLISRCVDSGEWKLGSLPDGYEFIGLVMRM